MIWHQYLEMKKSPSVWKVLCFILSVQATFTALVLLRIYSTKLIRPDDKRFDYDYGDTEEIAVEWKECNGVYQIYFQWIYGNPGKQLAMESDSSDSGMFAYMPDKKQPVKTYTLNIYSQSSIGVYLWENILQAKRSFDFKHPGVLVGNTLFREMNFFYTEESEVNLLYALNSSNPLILVCDARTQNKVTTTKTWLDNLHGFQVFLVLLGDEKCENNWIKDYLQTSGPVKGAFLTYDDPMVDRKLFLQWPLGTSMFSEVSSLPYGQILVRSSRKYMCNFANYHNSSADLLDILRSNSMVARNCYVALNLNPKSNARYLRVLVESDLTLCPPENNVETSRIYDAMEAGSIPVILDEPSNGNCDSKSLRLLKQYNAPLLLVASWKDLSRLLETEARLSNRQKVQRRLKLLQWYKWFKERMKFQLYSFIEKRLLEPN